MYDWEKKRILVTVKAYPEKSKKHGTTVCTAGITEDGGWIRLYPMPYTSFLGSQKIQRYDWIEVECEKATGEKPGRKESNRVRDDSVEIIDRTRKKMVITWFYHQYNSITSSYFPLSFPKLSSSGFRKSAIFPEFSLDIPVFNKIPQIPITRGSRLS